MEIIRHIDVLITLGTIVTLGWFLMTPSQREKSAGMTALLYTVGAPFDIIFARDFSFWMSLINSAAYLWIYVMYRKERLAKNKQPKRNSLL